jgi:ribonuclease BN (tRNA processing enzyme)
MKLRVLGCSGGIGGEHLRTTSLLVDDDVLIDAGTGLGDLSIAELTRIDHVFLTHTHLDHIACLPLMMDSVADRRSKPLTVHGTQAVLDILKAHIFNWQIWPDFTRVPSAENAFMRYQPLELLQPVQLGGRSFTALPVDHTIPAVAYRLDSGVGSLVFSGDTGPCDVFWQAVNQIDNLRHVIIECAFPDREAHIAGSPSISARACWHWNCQARAGMRNSHHPSQAGADGADDGRNRGIAWAISGHGCCATTRCSSFEIGRSAPGSLRRATYGKHLGNT